MTKLVTFLGRKTAPEAGKPSAAPTLSVTPPAKPEIELDHELFSPIATQLGQENEAVRNLLLDAEHKIGELETIKRSIGKLVEPVTKTLRAYEESKSEKLSLQGVLNSTRVAYDKIRADLAASEKKAAASDGEAIRLRDIVSVAQQSVVALERTKAEQLAELSARRTHIAELQRHAQQLDSDLQLARDENRRSNDRIASADKRAVQLEGQTLAAQQKAMQATQERGAVQASLDKALGELAQTARRLNDTEKALGLTQGRLKALETSLGEAQAERARLSATLDEANHKHLDQVNLQSSRFEALKARASLTESLLDEARQTLMARADEIRTFERQIVESATVREVMGEKISRLEAALTDRELQVRDLEESRATLTEQAKQLGHAVVTREVAYGTAQKTAAEQSDLVELLEKQLQASRDASEMQIAQLSAQLQREQLERSMAEGALEAGRKDIARLMREVAALQYRPVAATPSEGPLAQQPVRLRSVA